MVHISKSAEVNAQAWQFAEALKEQLAQLNQSVANSGNPDVDPNDPQNASGPST